MDDLIEGTVTLSRKKSRKSKLQNDEKITIVYRVIVQKEMIKDVAKEFRICNAYVS